jgi:hypothetical protein
MALKRSKDYGKKTAERGEPLTSLKKFVKMCRQAEAEERKLLGDEALTAGEMLFGCGKYDTGLRWKPATASLLDKFLSEVKEWGM